VVNDLALDLPGARVPVGGLAQIAQLLELLEAVEVGKHFVGMLQEIWEYVSLVD